ncbi:MAG: NTP transferase domain-containing protein [Chloroflexi bacterium]|nr:NTP transferase domain-containing protein [Chloroflexota bacterium]
MKQAIILAAGEGRRLRPFTVNRPKAMISIAHKPILQYVIEALAQNGVLDIVLVVGYRKEQVFDHIGSGEQLGVNITYVTQAEQLGTAHALLQAREVAADEFLVMSGDKLIEADTVARFIETAPPAVLVKKVPDPVRYGVVSIDERGMVKSIVEKPKVAETNIANTGIYAFSREVFDFAAEVLDIPDALNNMISSGRNILAVETTGVRLDVVYPWDILSLNEAVIRRVPLGLGGVIESGVSLRGRVTVGQDTVIRANSTIVGPVVIGSGCDIGPNACILPATSIGDNVTVSAFTALQNSVIGNDVNIGPGCIIQDSVIGRGCVIKGHFTACTGQAEVKVNGEYHQVNLGAMLGEGCNLGNSVVAQPGAILGNNCQVQALKLVAGRLPDKSLVV